MSPLQLMLLDALLGAIFGVILVAIFARMRKVSLLDRGLWLNWYIAAALAVSVIWGVATHVSKYLGF